MSERLQLKTMISGRPMGRTSDVACLLVTIAAYYYLLMGQAIADSAKPQPRRIAEMQLQRWREELPGVAVPEAVLARLSPLNETQVHKFKAILQNPNATMGLNASEFCGSSDLLCHQNVVIVMARAEAYGVNRGYTKEEQRRMFIAAEELKEGGRLTMPDLQNQIPWKAFLPQSLAEMMPFSSSTLPRVLSLLSISPSSNMSHNIASTLKECEGSPEEGEVRTCSTSIESMVDFVVSKLGGSVELVSQPTIISSATTAHIRNLKRKEYVPSRAPAACHTFVFPFGVYFGHFINGTHTYHMELQIVDDDNVTKGNIVNGTAVCHHFSKANATACHLIYGDTILWLPKGHN